LRVKEEILKKVIDLLKIIGLLLERFSKRESGRELPSPKIRIKTEDIIYNPQNHTFLIKNVTDGSFHQTVQDTNSMEPVFDIGHRLFIEPIKDYADLIVGDIVWFVNPAGAHIIHRIVKIQLVDGIRHYQTKGDNCAFRDPYDLIDKDILYLYRGEYH
jgi:hypothetical protein